MREPTELDISKEMREKHFRVTMFGSARIQKGDRVYEQVFDLAKLVGAAGMDVVTGGGPGIMEAANAGHNAGDAEDKAESIGLRIELSFEQSTNDFVEFRKSFHRFAERLETFARLSDVFVVCPGGIGTLLELSYCWQLVQVKKLEYKPIILVGEMWERLIYWVIDFALKDHLISAEDFDYIYIAKDNEQAMELIKEFREQKKKNGKMFPIPKYKKPHNGWEGDKK